MSTPREEAIITEVWAVSMGEKAATPQFAWRVEAQFSQSIAEAEERGRRAAEARYADIWAEGFSAGWAAWDGPTAVNPYRVAVE